MDFIVDHLKDISIHAAREGGDALQALTDNELDISIHAAREGGDVPVGVPVVCGGVFQSTPPVKAATFTVILHWYYNTISIHAAREGGDQSAWTAVKPAKISIHAAREGGDIDRTQCNSNSNYFNPRRP